VTNGAVDAITSVRSERALAEKERIVALAPGHIALPARLVLAARVTVVCRDRLAGQGAS
jgi:hypothetical protein